VSGAKGDTYVPVKHPALLLTTVMLSTVIITIDTTIANVALPHMQGALSATQDQISWVLTSYIVASAIMTPPSGYLAAKLGRRNLMLWCVGGFLVSSMLCGAATSLTEIVVFRTLQGACGAAISPIGQALVMDHFPPEKRGQVLSIWGMGVMIGPIIGPSLGGYLTESLNWRWVFYINLPLCVLALVGIFVAIPSDKNARTQPFDFFGFGLISLFIAALQLMLDRGHSLNWFQSLEIIIEAAVAGLCLYLFTVHMFTARHPFIEPKLFTDRNLMVGFVVAALTQVVMMGQMALLPNFLQQLMHVPVDTTGYLLMPRGIASVTGMALTARLIGRIDNRYMMMFGLALLGLSMYEMSKISLYVSNQTIILIGLMQGFGMSFLSAPMTTAVFATLSPVLRGEGASMYSLMRNMGGSIGISLFFTRIAEQTQMNHQYLGENITEFSADTLPSIWDWKTTAGAMTLDSEIVRQAASIAYLDAYLLMAVCMITVIPLCIMFREPKQRALPVQTLAAEH
jgi:DHA2 family multidrug resistance protein